MTPEREQELTESYMNQSKESIVFWLIEYIKENEDLRNKIKKLLGINQ